MLSRQYSEVPPFRFRIAKLSNAHHHPPARNFSAKLISECRVGCMMMLEAHYKDADSQTPAYLLIQKLGYTFNSFRHSIERVTEYSVNTQPRHAIAIYRAGIQ